MSEKELGVGLGGRVFRLDFEAKAELRAEGCCGFWRMLNVESSRLVAGRRLCGWTVASVLFSSLLR